MTIKFQERGMSKPTVIKCNSLEVDQPIVSKHSGSLAYLRYAQLDGVYNDMVFTNHFEVYPEEKNI